MDEGRPPTARGIPGTVSAACCQEGGEAELVVHREGEDQQDAEGSWKGRVFFSITVRIRVEPFGASEDAGSGRIKIPDRRVMEWV